MKILKYLKIIGLGLICFLLTNCSDWLEIETPKSMIISSDVFKNEASAKGAMQGIYNQLYVANFSAGWLGSVSVLSGLSSDIVKPIRTNSFNFVQFDEHKILSVNHYNQGLWDSGYNIVYLTNAFLEGLNSATQLPPHLIKQLEGQAKFVRAFAYFYLVNLYGDIPLVLSTNYKINAQIKISSKNDVYQQIVKDLKSANKLLPTDYLKGERTYVNRYAAQALLARTYLYLQNWAMAEKYSSAVIAQSSIYTLLKNLDQIFIANSRAAIWQLSPIGSGTGATNTNEGNVFIINPVIPSLSYLKLSEKFVDEFQQKDKRRSKWIRYHKGLAVYYPFKYKIQNSMDDVVEYSMALRLAEQYLIRAEARAQQNKITGAIEDLDRIRHRAGLDLIANTNPGISKNALLKQVAMERKREFFTEWGHRWLDLKRTEKAQKILASDSSGWDNTDKLYPIPEEELLDNPNLSQNPGY